MGTRERSSMVFYYTICGGKYDELGIVVFMGRDKYENEGLIAHGWPEDIWFHVDDYSSAHVYLRLPKGPLRKTFRETGNLNHLPGGMLKELCILTKNNSIEGGKCSDVNIVYTPWENLQKRQDMDVGTIGYHNQSKRVIVKNVAKEREVAKRIEKTKSEDIAVDFEAAKAVRDRHEIVDKKERAKVQRKLDEKDARERADEKESRSYDRMFTDEQLNKTAAATIQDEDDFMGEGSDIEADELADEFADFL